MFGIGLLVIAQQQPAGAVVRGRVVYEDTGAPLRRTWVGLSQIRSFENTVESNSNMAFGFRSSDPAANAIGDSDDVVLTDDNGYYLLKDVRPGIYFPTVRQVGIVNPTIKDISDTRFQQVTVIGPEEIKFDIAAKRGGSIEGTVRYQDGTTAIGVSVRIERTDDREVEGSSSTTDDRGVYRFPGLREGDYWISVSESVVHCEAEKLRESYEIADVERSSILKTYYPSSYERNENAAVAVNLGAAQSNIDITIPNHPFVSVTGVVVAASDNTPVPGLRISFNKIAEGITQMSVVQKVTTNQDGSWAFSYLLPGQYEFSVERDDEFLKPDQNGKERKLASVSKVVDIVEGTNDNIIIALPFAASISGTIELADKKPVSNGYLFVGASNPETSARSSAFVRSEQGAVSAPFALDDIAPGEVMLSVFSSFGYVVEINLKGKNVVDELISVAEAETIEGVRIILSDDMGTIRGRVTNVFANADARRLYLIPADYVEKKATVSQRVVVIDIKPDGSFEEEVRPDRYYLVARESPKIESEDFDVVELIEEWIRGAEIVEIKSGETVEKNVSLEQ